MILQKYWTNIEILGSGDQYFTELLTAFRHAEQIIQVEMYIFSIDSVTKILLEELVKARGRGVRVQILVDGVGSYYSIQTLRTFCSAHSFEFRVYQPLPFSSATGTRMFRVYILSLLVLARKLNRRNHRKVVLIDRKRAFVGSMNWTQVHSRKAMGPNAWRDTSVSVEGEDVEVLFQSFNVTWFRARKMAIRRFRKKPPLLRKYDPRKSMVRLNTGVKDRWRAHRDLMKRIGRATDRVHLTTAYFMPHRALMRALRKAVRRGVDVRIITPGPSDVPIVKWASFEVAQKMVRDGIHIYEYQTSILHAKVVMIDDWIAVGSSNLNHRSVYHDLECEVVLTDKTSIEVFESHWQVDLRNSLPFSPFPYDALPWWDRWLYRLAFRLRYFL